MSLGESLKVMLGADADPLVKELAKAERSINEFGRSAKESLEKVRGAAESFGALVGVALGGSLIELGKSMMENAAALQDQASQLGINVEKLQAFRVAAQAAGVDQDTLNVGLNKLSKLLGEASGGSTEAQKVFQKWGISLKDASGHMVNLEELINRVSDRFASITDPALRSAAAVEMFGKSGFNLINFLSKGSEGLAEMEEKARRMGAVIDEQTTKKAKEASDQLKLMGDVISTNLIIALVNVLPSAEQLAEVLKKIAQYANYAKVGFNDIGDANLTTLQEHINAVTTKLAELRAEKAKGEKQDFVDTNGMEHLNGSSLDYSIKQTEDYLNSLKALYSAKQEHERVAARPIVPKPKAKVDDTGFRPVDLNAADEAQKEADAYAKGEQQITDYIAKLKEEHTELTLNAKDKEIQKNLFEAEAIARRNNIDLTVEQRASIVNESAAIADQNKVLEDTKKKMEENRQFGQQLAASMTSSFESAIISGNSVRNVFAGLLQDIEKMILRFMFLKPLTESLGEMFSGGSGGGVGGFLGSMFGGAIGGARATGGAVNSGTPYLVGEHGPELVVPNLSSMVVPNNQMSSLGSSSGSGSMNSHFNFNVNVSGPAAGDPRTAAQSGAAFAQSAKSILLEALQEQMRQGGMLYGR